MNILLCKWDEFLVREILAAGHACYLILDQFDCLHATLADDLKEGCSRIYTIKSPDSIEEIAAVASDLLCSRIRIDRVIGNGEYANYAAGLLAELLGASNYSLNISTTTRDKRLMKFRLKNANVRAAKWVSLNAIHNADATVAKVEELGYPVVIKPANGVGTRITAKVESHEQLMNYISDVLTQMRPPLFSNHFVAEEFVDGEEFHVDAVWSQGEPVFFSVGRYHSPCLNFKTRMYGSMLVDRESQPDLYEDLLDMNLRVNHAYGIRTACTHMEVFRDRRGELFFSEIATRPGGGYIMEAIREKYSVCLRSQYVRALIGTPPSPNAAPKGNHLNCIGFLNLTPKQAGRITSMPSSEEIKNYPGVLKHEIRCKVGDDFHNSHGCNWMIMLVLGAPNIKEYEALVDRIPVDLAMVTTP